jgi:hypothetical protein
MSPFLCQVLEMNILLEVGSTTLKLERLSVTCVREIAVLTQQISEL